MPPSCISACSIRSTTITAFAPLEAAAQALDIHNAAARWNKALLDNAARPSGALVYRGRTARQSDRGAVRAAEGASSRRASRARRNAGRPLVLEGGLDWKAMALSPKDMDFIEAKHAAAREIALAFGVPPMLLGIPGRQHLRQLPEANRAFWRQTVLPLVARTAKALSGWLGPPSAGLVACASTSTASRRSPSSARRCGAARAGELPDPTRSARRSATAPIAWAATRLLDSGELSISGYASLFGVADRGGDLVMPGAFRRMPPARGSAGIRMLLQHDPGQPIGVWTRHRARMRAGCMSRGELSLGAAACATSPPAPPTARSTASRSASEP